MAAKPKLTAEQRQYVIDVMAARRALPSDKGMARQLGISVSALYRTIENLPREQETAIPLTAIIKRLRYLLDPERDHGE